MATSNTVIRSNCTTSHPESKFDFGTAVANYLEEDAPVAIWPRSEVVTILLYLSLVLVILPRYMAHRQPYKLQAFIHLYNIAQIAVNLVLVYMYVDIMNFKPLNVWQNTCEAIKTANGGIELILTNKMINFALLFSINKTMDLLDTVIFCLKKKQSQVTFLHVYHHVAMKLATSISLFNHYKVDLNSIMAGLNSFVHVIMYTYYLLANMGPRMRRYLWWKSHLTKLQILQFLVIITLLAKLHWQGCQHTAGNMFISLWTFTIGSIFLLFCHFYYKTYKIKAQ